MPFGSLLKIGASKLLSKISKPKVMPGVGSAVGRLALPPIAGAAAGALGRIGTRVGGAAGRIVRSPVGGAIAGTVAGGMILDQFGNPVRRRRRGRGFSARDIRQTRKMLKLIKEMQSAIPRKRC